MKREDVATKADVERLLANRDAVSEQKEQDRLRKLFSSRARLTERERRLGHGIMLEDHYRRTGNKNGLAEALTMQGRLAEAAAVAERATLKASILEKLEAVNCCDDDCECPSFEAKHGLQIPTQYVEGYQISQKHGGELMPAIRCRKCNKLNVRPNFDHLARQHKARATSIKNENKQVAAIEFFDKSNATK